MRKLIPLLVLAACSEDAKLGDAASNNPKVAVAYMLTIEDCRIYRFYDSGYRYVAICGPVQKATTIFEDPAKIPIPQTIPTIRK